MVSSIPLPPTQRTLDTGVLTSEAPSPAPVTAKEKTEPPPSPKEVAIPEKITKPIKTAEKPTPTPPKHIQPITPDPTKAVTGETAGVRVAMSTMEVKNGTASVSVDDRTFGSRFAYYVNIVNSKVAQNWLTLRSRRPRFHRQEHNHHLRHQPRWCPVKRPRRDSQRVPHARPLCDPRRAACRRLWPTAAGQPHHGRVHVPLAPVKLLVRCIFFGVFP